MTVVIPTRNSARTLDVCLSSVRSQTYGTIEVVVVDNRSTDETQQIALAHGARFIPKNSERSAARNEGAKRAKGEYVAFIDSDMELESMVVQECVRVARGGYDAIIIPEVSMGTGFWAQCRSLEKLCYIGDDDIEAPRFFSRDAFLREGGYDERIVGGEDWDLAARIQHSGEVVGRIEPHITHHEGRIELDGLIRKKYYYGLSVPVYHRKGSVGWQLLPLRPAFMRQWRKLIANPRHAVGLAVLKGIEFIAGGMGYLVGAFSGNQYGST